MTKQETIDYWKNHIHQAELFKGSFSKYCKSVGIQDYTFYYWRDKLLRGGRASSTVRSSFIRAELEIPPRDLKRISLPDPEWVASIILCLQKGLE